MALTEITRYYSRWDLDNHTGKVILYSSTGTKLFEDEFSDPNEFKVIMDLLRYEKPLYFSDTLKHLRTGTNEPVGEEEG